MHKEKIDVGAIPGTERGYVVWGRDIPYIRVWLVQPQKMVSPRLFDCFDIVLESGEEDRYESGLISKANIKKRTGTSNAFAPLLSNENGTSAVYARTTKRIKDLERIGRHNVGDVCRTIIRQMYGNIQLIYETNPSLPDPAADIIRSASGFDVDSFLASRHYSLRTKIPDRMYSQHKR